MSIYSRILSDKKIYLVQSRVWQGYCLCVWFTSFFQTRLKDQEGFLDLSPNFNFFLKIIICHKITLKMCNYQHNIETHSKSRSFFRSLHRVIRECTDLSLRLLHDHGPRRACLAPSNRINSIHFPQQIHSPLSDVSYFLLWGRGVFLVIIHHISSKKSHHLKI